MLLRYIYLKNLRPATLLKKRLWHRCFPVNFFEISKNIFFTEHLWMSASETKTKQIGHIIRIILTEYQYQYQSIIGSSGSGKTKRVDKFNKP